MAITQKDRKLLYHYIRQQNWTCPTPDYVVECMFPDWQYITYHFEALMHRLFKVNIRIFDKDVPRIWEPEFETEVMPTLLPDDTDDPYYDDYCDEDDEDYEYYHTSVACIGDYIEATECGKLKMGYVVGVIYDHDGQPTCYKVARRSIPDLETIVIDYIQASRVSLDEPGSLSCLREVGYKPKKKLVRVGPWIGIVEGYYNKNLGDYVYG